jgi:GH43 family beta-xylosidase
MKKISVLAFLILAVSVAFAQQKTYTLDDINIRDPYIMPVEKEGVYYMYASSGVSENGKYYGGVVAYKSRDLKTWEGPVRVFTVPHDNYLTGNVWAPEVHKYKGKYYLFATLNSDVRWKAPKAGHPAYNHRATQIFWSKSPEGPFLPFEGKAPHTPLDEMCLDGTLWVENGTPYMIYCHEWVEVADGEMDLVELEKDLSAPIGAPQRLFCASAAEWSTGGGKEGNKTYVTDGCFLYRSKTGKLLMMWSSFKDGVYAVGLAESDTGKIIGPWRQQKEPIFINGGHSMLFTDFEGRLCLVLHSPNSPGGKERAKIFEVEDLGHTLRVKGERK